MKAKSTPFDQEGVRGSVRRAYGKIASSGGSCGCGSTSCCGPQRPDAVAMDVGYSESDLSCLPPGANMGLSCGNPTALASLERGEVVLDLGSGGGFDCFIAATRVGRRGRVIGVDMTPEMLAKARSNITVFRKRTGLDNVEFRLGEIEHLPVADASVNVVISNCVINLSPDKPQVWREIARVLRPGGRVAVSDLALLRPLPASLAKSVAALTGCIAGAALIRDVLSMVKSAGLVGVDMDSHGDLAAAIFAPYDNAASRRKLPLPKGKRLTDYVTSLYVTARKRRATPPKRR